MKSESYIDQPGIYIGVQSLRFFAALAVLWAHISLIINERFGNPAFPISDIGFTGVAVFFVISGFVLFVSTPYLIGVNGSGKDFALRRIIRLVPLYWIATTLKLLIVLLIPSETFHSSFMPFHTIASYLFIAARNKAGDISPLHAVGWTLNYEMFFYFLFAAALYFKKSPLLFVGGILVALVIGGLFFDPYTTPAFVAYMQPIVLQFLLGMFIGYVCVKGWKVNTYFLVLMLLVGLYIDLTVKVPGYDLGWESFLVVGIPSALIVAGAALLEPKLQRWIPVVLRQLGDSTYSLYLFHPFIFGVMAFILVRADINKPGFIFPVMIVCAVIAGWLIYRYLELPLTKFFRKLAKPYLLSHKSLPVTGLESDSRKITA